MGTQIRRIGIISDTHGLLRPETARELAGCEVILHGGDIGRQGILDELTRIAPVSAVCGNTDEELAGHLPEYLTVRFGEITFFMIHDRKTAKEIPDDADVVVFGHTHRFEVRCEETDGRSRLWLNPGSCGPKRFFQPVTMAVFETDPDGSCRVERIEIADRGGVVRREIAARKDMGDGGRWQIGSAGAGMTGGPGAQASGNRPAGAAASSMAIPANIGDLLPSIIRDINRGCTVSEIAGRAGISRELAEQIVRMYLTHPGVDTAGILRRIGV